MTLFPWLSRNIFAVERGIPSIPPARAFAWDISRKGSTLTQDVRITEFDGYDIILAFGDRNASYEDGRLHEDKKRDSSWRKLYGEYEGGRRNGPFAGFLGGVGVHYVTKDHGTLVVPRTPEEYAQRDELWRRGELIAKPSEPGIEIPVRLKVERIPVGGGSETVFDASVVTAGDEGSRMRFKQRFLARGLKLAPASYRITATTIRDTPIPAGIGIYLAIPLSDWKVSRPKY